MRVRIFDTLGNYVKSFPSEMHYDFEYRNNHEIISEKFVTFGQAIENEYHGLVYDTNILEVTVSN